MKLQDGPLVQWKDGEAWNTGCLLVNQHGDMLTLWREQEEQAVKWAWEREESGVTK